MSHGGGNMLTGLFEGPVHFIDKYAVGSQWFLLACGFGIGYYVFQKFDIASNSTFGFIAATAPVWLPIITFLLFFEFWLYFIRKQFDMAQGRVTLEIKLPQEIFKSPEAMEMVLVQMHQTAAPDNHVQTYWDGKHPPVYSLELVSRGGDIRFYINTPKKKFKNIIETQLYAQYPGVEVHELDIDYTAEIPWDPKRFEYFSIHMGLKKADAYPIKTYIEYGLDRMPKEEEKVDPITSMLEVLGTVGPGEFYWIQILITANREIAFKEGSLRTEPDWKGAARAEIKNIINKAVEDRGGEEVKGNIMMLLTDTEKDTIKAIERSLAKNAFNTMIRTMYIAESERYTPGERIGPLITGWRSYDELNRNAIGVKWRTDVDWPWWQDPHGHLREHMKKEELHDYKIRSYTSHSDSDGAKVMTTEELATIFHLPGKVATTPTLGRIPSKRAEAPANLPIE